MSGVQSDMQKPPWPPVRQPVRGATTAKAPPTRRAPMAKVELRGGSDRGRTRTLEFSRTRCFRPLRQSPRAPRHFPTRGSSPAVPPEHWPEVVERARDESLRSLARVYGVSHNAIRTVLIKTGHAHLLDDDRRRQRLAAEVPLPPPAAAKIPKERYREVALLCQRHTQAEVAASLRVSQATIWRIVQQEKQR